MESLSQLQESRHPRRIVLRAVEYLVPFQRGIAAEMVPMRGKNDMVILQLRVCPFEPGNDVLRGNIAEGIFETHVGSQRERNRFEIGAERSPFEVIEVLPGSE